jgi:exonuclease SbcC
MKTIRKLIIENFQSHAYSELDLDDGLNVIVGASDQGKSSIIRALRWVLYNEPRGADFMRVGANYVRVTLHTNDGYIVTRERTASKNRYQVISPDGNEQVYEGFGNSVPQEVIAAHGVEKILLDEGEEKMLHLGMQLDGPFLLSETGAVKAKAIGRLNGVHIIDAAHRDTARDLSRLQQEERTCHDQLLALQEELEQFDDLAYLENILLLVEEKQSRLQQLAGRLERLKRLRTARVETEKQLERAEQVLQQTETLAHATASWERAIQAQERVKRLRFLHEKMRNVQRELAICHQIERKTEGLALAQRKLETLQRTAEKKSRLAQWAGNWRELERSLSLAEHVLSLTGDVERGILLYDRLQHLVSRQERMRSSLEKLRRIEQDMQTVERSLSRLAGVGQAFEKWEMVAERLNRLQKLVRLKQLRADIEDRLLRAEQFLKDHLREMEKQVNAYQILLRRTGTCPVCFSPIDEHTAERILAEFTGGVKDGGETGGA